MTCHKPTRYTIVEESRTSQAPYESVRPRSLNSDRTRSCRLHQNHRASAIEPEQPHPDFPLPGLGFLVRPSPRPSGEAGGWRSSRSPNPFLSSLLVSSSSPDPLGCFAGHALMATAPAPADPKAEAAKMDLLEDDDEFEEFEIDQGTLLPLCPPSDLPLSLAAL